MNRFGGNYSSMHSPYIQYDPYSYYPPYDFNGPNYSYEPNDCYNSYDSSNSSSYDQASQYSNAYYGHSFQPYPSQDQSTQSKLHDLLLQMKNEISALRNRIDNQISEENTFDAYDEGETYEGNDNQITDLYEEKDIKMHIEDSSQQTPLDPAVEHEYISQYDDGVISTRDGDILNFSFKDMEECSEISDYVHDLSCYFEDDIPPQLLKDGSDDYDNNDDDDDDDDDDIISIDGVNLFDEEIHDALLKDEPIPHMRENDDSLINMSDMHVESDLYAVIEEAPNVSNADIKDMYIAPNVWSTERCTEESPIIISIDPPMPEYFIHGERVFLEEICHEYHDPYWVPTYAEYHDQSLIRYTIKDMSHSFHLPPSLSCLHHYIFMKSSKKIPFSFIVSKIKNHKKITLKVKFLPAFVGLIHWEDYFPLFLLFYDLD